MKALLRKNRLLYQGFHELRLLHGRSNRATYCGHDRELSRFTGDNLERLAALALAPPVFWERELLAINEQYAHDLTLKKYLGLDLGTRLGVIIEHGLVLNRSLVENHLNYPLARRNIVMSRARAEYLASMGVKAAPIGPYLHYAAPVFSAADLASLRQKLGKTLLFFPSHSTQDVSVVDSYRDLNAMLIDLTKRHGFDSVLVCGYFIDIENGLFDRIEKRDGIHFISCGHRFGPGFLALLKTWLLLADVAASNSLGTQAGYALYCGKPFWVVGEQAITRFYSGAAQRVADERAATAQPLIGERSMSFEDLEALFRHESYRIDPEVYRCVSGLWGFEDVLDRDGLWRALFDPA